MIDSVNRKSPSRLGSSELTGEFDEYPLSDEDIQQRRLLVRILQRIESRLPGRIRQLSVYVAENAIVLSGCCSTYHTKQVAQHTAMGVLEYERLINNIDVCSPR